MLLLYYDCITLVNNVLIVSRVVADLLFPNPAGAGFCRILMANPTRAGFFTVATTWHKMHHSFKKSHTNQPSK